jgi:hypothetical protein
MAKYIIHRVNNKNQIQKDYTIDGFECDINNYKKKLVMHHDLNKKGDTFKKFFFKIDKRQIVFLNIKSSGIINQIINKIKNKRNIFLLDISFSEIDFLLKKNLSKLIILRYSIYEKLNLKSKFFKKVIWVWVDFFQNKKIDFKTYKYIKKYKKKICLASPELLGGKKSAVINYVNYLNKNNIKEKAICTKKEFINAQKRNYKY